METGMVKVAGPQRAKKRAGLKGKSTGLREKGKVKVLVLIAGNKDITKLSALIRHQKVKGKGV